MIAGPGRDWIAWFATARWNAGVNEAYTARSICFASFVRKVLLLARKASEGSRKPSPRDRQQFSRRDYADLDQLIGVE